MFSVCYDLIKPDFDYQPLYEALDQINAQRIQDSFWGVNTTSSEEVVFDYLWQHMHSSKDRLAVIPFHSNGGYKSQNAITPFKEL